MGGEEAAQRHGPSPGPSLPLSEWPWTCDGTSPCLGFPIWRVGVLFLLGVAEKPTTLANHADKETDVTPQL